MGIGKIKVLNFLFSNIVLIITWKLHNSIKFQTIVTNKRLRSKLSFFLFNKVSFQLTEFSLKKSC